MGHSLVGTVPEAQGPGLGASDMNASLPESMSDDLDWLPPEPGHNRPDRVPANAADRSVFQPSDAEKRMKQSLLSFPPDMI